MADRITIAQLQSVCDRANRMTGSPMTSWTATTGKGGMTANLGNYHLDQAYGGVGVARMGGEGGAITMIINITTKRLCYEKMQAYLDGIAEGKTIK